MQELCQLNDEHGTPLSGKGATKDEIFAKGLLHSATHIWIWRKNDQGKIEILLQQRSAVKRTWPNCLDISAAGHVDQGEEPITAGIRELYEEIGITATPGSLRLMAVLRSCLVTENGEIENEFQWLYSFEYPKDAVTKLQTSEVDSVKWMSYEAFADSFSSEDFVPHGQAYYHTVLESLGLLSKQ